MEKGNNENIWIKEIKSFKWNLKVFKEIGEFEKIAVGISQPGCFSKFAFDDLWTVTWYLKT